MTTPPSPCRPASPHDARHLPALTPWLDQDHAAILIAPAEGPARAAAAIDAVGLPAEPGVATLHLLAAENAAASDEPHLAGVIGAAMESARAAGHDRLVTRCDPLDRPAVRRLERHGFRPTGTPPYFQIGPEQLQYVTGYQDAAGSWLDLAVTLDPTD